MKIRFGFVSNSSSSSFTCDVCGETCSGMDASARDFEMTQCVNGHCFCDAHQEKTEDPSPDKIREIITKYLKEDYSYMDKTWREGKIQELADTEDEDLLDLLRDEYSDDGCPSCDCPICTFSVLRDSDGFAYLKKKFNLTNENILAEIKADFKNYDELTKVLK